MPDTLNKTEAAPDRALSTPTKWLLVLALVVLGKMSGLLKDILLTFYHGVSDVTDAYFLSGSIASVVYMAVYATVPVIVVPLYSRIRNARSNSVVGDKLSSAYLFFIALTLALTVSVHVFAPYLVDRLAGDVIEQTRASATQYLRIMSLTFVLSTIVAFLNAVQTVDKIVIPSYLVPIVNNSLFCFGLFVFTDRDSFGNVLYLGLAAWLMLAIVNYFFLSEKALLSPRWSKGFLHDEKFLVLLLPAFMAFGIEYANSFVGVYFAAGLKSGSISVLAYANKLNLILVSVFLVILTTSIFPKVALAVASDNSREISAYLSRLVRAIAVFGLPVIVYAIYCSEEIVGLLFERGHFTRKDVLSVSAIFSIVLAALPFSLLRDIMNRVYFSYNNTVVPAVATFAAFSLNAILSFLLHDELGLSGLAIAMVTSTVLNGLAMVWLVQKKTGQALGGGVLRVISRCVIAVSCALMILVWSYRYFDGYWILLFAPYSVFYFAILYVFRVDEVVAAAGLVKNMTIRR